MANQISKAYLPENFRNLIPVPDATPFEPTGEGLGNVMGRMLKATAQAATWDCPDCGNPVMPREYHLTRSKANPLGGKRFLPRTFCSCKGGSVRRQRVEAAWADQDREDNRRDMRYAMLRTCGLSDSGMTKDSWIKDTEPRKKAWGIAEKIISTIARENRGGFWWGPYGCGKTHLAYAVATELVMNGMGAVVINWIAKIREIQQTWSTNGTDAPIWRSFVATPVLFLDDWDKQLPRPEDIGRANWRLPANWYLDSLYWIVDQRYRANQVTILISNLTYPEIEKVFQAIGGTAANAILSRMNRSQSVRVDWGKLGLTEYERAGF